MTERAAALCSHRAFVEAGALYEAAFALEPNRERFIQGDYCYRNCTVAYYRYSQCDRLRASLRGNQFAKRYIEWNAKSQKQPFAHDSDARLVYNGPAYANLFTKSVEELLAREPSVKIWHDCTRGFQHYCGIEPGADEAEVLQLGREIRHVQEMKWDLVAGMRRQRGIPIDELLLCRLFDTASCITPAEATGELKAAMAEIDRLQAAGHRVAVKRAPFFGIVNEPIDRVATLFRAVTVMVDMRWHAEELLPLLDWLSAYNDPAVKLIGLYGKTRLKGEPGRDATEKLVEALSQPSCPVARFVVEQMAAESGYAPPETREIWRPLWATATTPRNPMRPNVFIDLRQTRDRIGPWARYRITPVSLEGMKEASAQMVHLVVDESGTGPGEGGPVFILWDLTGSPTDRDHRTFRSSEEVRQYLLTRLRPEDGTMTEVERFKMKVLPYRAEMVLERNALYFNPQGGPLAIVRRGDVAYVREADGLPMPEVGPLAWFADRLYLGGAGALARFDPESRRFELLASSRSVAPRHELDGGGLWTVRSILPDAERKCLWLSVDRDLWKQDRGGESRYGIWKFTPADGSLRRVFVGPPSYLAWSDGQIVFLQHTNRGDVFHRLDPATEKAVVLCNGRKIGPTLEHRLPLWALVNENIIFSSWCLFANDSLAYKMPPRGPNWNYVVRLGPGVLVCNVAAKDMWYISPRPAGEVPESASAPPVLVPRKLRTWHDVVENSSFEAGLVGVNGEMVIMRKANGSNVVLPVDRLSDADRQYIAGVARGSPD